MSCVADDGEALAKVLDTQTGMLDNILERQRHAAAQELDFDS